MIKTWLENVVRRILTARKGEIRTIAIGILTEDGTVETAYYGGAMTDKLIIAGVIQQDAILQVLAANEDNEPESEEG